MKEKEEEGKDDRDKMLRVPVPSPSSVPVLGNPEQSIPEVGCTTNVPENDASYDTPGVKRNLEIGIYQQECIFGLKEKIAAMRAKIAEAKESKSQGEGAPSIPLPAMKKEKSTSRAEEIKIRVEELNQSLAKLKCLVLNKFLYSILLKHISPFHTKFGTIDLVFFLNRPGWRRILQRFNQVWILMRPNFTHHLKLPRRKFGDPL